MTEEQGPRVGIGVLIFKDGKVLLGPRKGAHGQGEYAAPGGHLHFMESPEECARREIREETGLEVENIRFLCLSNLMKYDGKHYIDIGMVADWKSGEPKVMEPDKCEFWDWYDLDNLPSPLFGSEPNYFKTLKSAGNMFPNNYFSS